MASVGTKMPRISILYVDDDTDSLDIGGRYLEMTGDFIVTSASSASEAIHLLLQRSYDVIVSDYQMPEMNGIEFFKHIRKIGDTTPFIIISEKGREDVVIEALNCGVDFYLHKDGDLKAHFEELPHKVREAVSHHMEERALRESEALYNMIIENSLDCIKFLDPKGNLLFMSEGGQRLLEISDINRYIGRPWTDFWTGVDHDAAEKAVAQAVNGGVGKFIGYSPTERGNPKWWDVIVTPIKDRDGEVDKLLAISRDITEHKLEEAAFDLIKKRNAMLLEALPDMMFVLSRDGVFRDFNVPNSSILAVPSDKIIGTNIRDSGFGKETTDTIMHHIGLALELKKLQLFEYGLVMPDGEHQYEARMVALSEDSVLGIVRDITERKRDEERLSENEKRFRTYMDYSPEGIFITDARGNFQDVNRTACNMLNYSREEMLGMNIPDISDKNTLQEDMEKFQELQKKGSVARETILIRKDGTGLPIFLNAVELPDNRYIAFCTDITERKQSEMIIRESERKFHAIFNASQDGMILIDIELKRFVMVNKAIQKMTGYTEAELLDLTISDMHPAADLPFVKGQFENAVRGESDLAPDIPMLRKDGTIFYCDISSSAQIIIQDRQYMLGVFRDITNRRRAANALRQANKQLTLLSSITRHDILNQLMALKGYLQLSHDVIDNPTILIDYIKKEEKAANSIEAQISFTRDYQELGAASPTWQNVDAIVQTAVAGLPMRSARVDVDHPDLEIFADPLLQKVFYNLIDNALRYGGEHMKTIRVSSQESDLGLIIIFEDDGIGITNEDKEHLFTRGYGKNTGLGLFLSREILAITGITITENGAPGKGARFELVVPNGQWRMKRSD